MSQPRTSQRELVFCHQCENEWYRDEHGIICPECQSDFTECIEPDHDPREENYAPDPDEDDIGQFEWTGSAPGEPPRLHGHFQHTITLGGAGQDQGGAGMGGLLGILGPALQGILRGPTQQQQQGQAPSGGIGDSTGNAEGAPPAAGSPQQGEQQHGHGGTFRGSGPGYAYTITTSNGLRPRDADMPQPVETEAVDLGTMMQRMIANIGVAPVHGADGHPPAFMGGHGHPMGIEDLLAMFNGLGPGGFNGDAVYSQQEFDRLISRLAEQHAAEQAPPRASDEAIEALPRRTITQEDFGDSGKAECSICIGKVNIGEEVTVLPCDHWFHHECVKPWLSSHDTCPHCRKGIMPKNDQNDPNDSQQEGQAQAPQNDPHAPCPGPGPGPGSRRPHEPNRTPHLHSPGSEQPPMSGMFNRMRDAFGSGSSGMRGSNNATSSGGRPSEDITEAHPANDE